MYCSQAVSHQAAGGINSELWTTYPCMADQSSGMATRTPTFEVRMGYPLPEWVTLSPALYVLARAGLISY